MVDCQYCGNKWGNCTIAYPSLDLSTIPNEKRFRKAGLVVNVEEYIDLRSQIQRLLPQGLPIPPGTRFGSLVGTTYGQHGDFTWTRPPTVLIHPEALNKLIAEGIKIPITVKPEIKARGKKLFEHLEIQTEAHLELSERCIKQGRPNCPACGSSGIKAFIAPDLIKKSSIPEGLDIFRMRVRNNYIHVTERFVDAVRRLELTNIRFEPFEVVDE